MSIKVALVTVLSAGAGYWAGYVQGSVTMRGREVFTGLVLLVLFLLVLAKVSFALVYRSGNAPPANGNGGQRPPDEPVPRPPGARPPALSAAAEVKHPSAA